MDDNESVVKTVKLIITGLIVFGCLATIDGIFKKKEVNRCIRETGKFLECNSVFNKK